MGKAKKKKCCGEHKVFVKSKYFATFAHKFTQNALKSMILKGIGGFYALGVFIRLHNKGFLIKA